MAFPIDLSVLGRTVSIQLSEILRNWTMLSCWRCTATVQNGPKLAEKAQVMVQELTERSSYTKHFDGTGLPRR